MGMKRWQRRARKLQRRVGDDRSFEVIRSLNEISRMSLCMFVQHPHLYIPIPVPPLWSFIRSLFDSHERAVCQQLSSIYSHGAPLTHHGIVPPDLELRQSACALTFRRLL
jgi:hypothetical protein